MEKVVDIIEFQFQITAQSGVITSADQWMVVALSASDVSKSWIDQWIYQARFLLYTIQRKKNVKWKSTNREINGICEMTASWLIQDLLKTCHSET